MCPVQRHSSTLLLLPTLCNFPGWENNDACVFDLIFRVCLHVICRRRARQGCPTSCTCSLHGDSEDMGHMPREREAECNRIKV